MNKIVTEGFFLENLSYYSIMIQILLIKGLRLSDKLYPMIVFFYLWHPHLLSNYTN